MIVIIKEWGCFAIEINIRQKAKADGYSLLVISYLLKARGKYFDKLSIKLNGEPIES